MSANLPHSMHGMSWLAPAPEELQPELPQYVIERLIGRGGMGAVYQARQKSLDREVAIKILAPTVLDSDMHYAERFIAEARSMARLDHPGIIAVYDAGQTANGMLYFVMAYVEGTDVAQMIAATGRLPAPHAHAITAHVCDALGYAHAHGLIHRDIKPANIMVDRQGRVRIADFGLANAVNEHTGYTKANMAVGTPDFVAPEALIAGMLIDCRADIYAVGVMLYQMLTGIVPRGAWHPASVIAPGVDPRFDQIILRAMQYDREARHSSALELRAHLDSLLFPAPDLSHYTPDAALPKPPAPAPHSTPRPKPAQRHQTAPLPKPKSKAPVWIGTLVFAAAVVALGAFILRSQGGGNAFAIPTLTSMTRQGSSNSLGMKFAPVPGTAVHFCVHETRYSDYAAFAAAVPNVPVHWKNQAHEGYALTGNAAAHPIVSVSWDDAQAFCTWLSQKERKTYRLPTDREWSLAVGLRDPDKPNMTDYPWGSQWPPPPAVGNYSDQSRKSKAPRASGPFIPAYDDGFPTTAPVMSFKPNLHGLHDLGGNALEWCEDWFDAKQKKERILRGSSWHQSDLVDLLAADRTHLTPDSHHNNLGFRIVLVP